MAIINYMEKHLKTFSVKPHLHNFWEVIYVTDGEGVLQMEDGNDIFYKKGETICIPPGVRHSNKSSSGFKNMHFTIEDWMPFTNEPCLIPESDLGKDFYALLKLSYRYFHQLSLNHPINISLMQTIVSFLNLLVTQSTTACVTQGLISEIINHYTEENFDLDEAYKSIPLSKEYIRKIFIKEHGVSPSKFLLQKRLTLAKKLLNKKDDGDLRINEIAKTCGFSDHAYFCRVFKKETGLTPNEFQLLLLRNNKVY